MRGFVTTIPDGDAGTYATVGHMARLAVEGSIAPLVRQVASRLVLGVSDGTLQARILRDWVSERTMFLPDPAGAEALHHPAWLLGQIGRVGIVQVDCDDVALLAAAMGASIGLRARFVVVGFSSPNAPFRHVWTELADSRAPVWVAVDPTRPMQGLLNAPVSRTWVLEI